MIAPTTRAEWNVMEAMYDVFAPLLRSKPQIAGQMAEEIDAIAQRYAEQHMQERNRPERYRGNPGVPPSADCNMSAARTVSSAPADSE